MKHFILCSILLLSFFVSAWGAKAPKRVVSLAPSITEIMFAIGAGDRLVAVTRYDNYPPVVSNLTRVGGIIDVDLEKLVILKPDLVLVSYSGNTPDKVERMKDLGLKTLLLKEKRVKDILSNIIILSRIMGKDPHSLLNRLESKLRNLPRLKKHPRAVVLISAFPFFSVSEHSFIGDAIEKAGFKNAVKSSVAYPQLDSEALVRLRPDVLILTSSLRRSGKEIRAIFRPFRQHPVLIYVNADRLSRPGPRIFGLISQLAVQAKALSSKLK